MILPILSFPDPLLKRKSVVVEKIDHEIITLASNMAETMYAAPGVGLAAPQVGVSQRLIVIDLAARNEASQLITVINPEIIHAEGSVCEEEGCLSVPDYSATVNRFECVTVKGLTINGEERLWQADGLLSIAFQHEIDHLDGILFVDRLSPLKREFYIKKQKKKGRL